MCVSLSCLLAQVFKLRHADRVITTVDKKDSPVVDAPISDNR